MAELCSLITELLVWKISKVEISRLEPFHKNYRGSRCWIWISRCFNYLLQTTLFSWDTCSRNGSQFIQPRSTVLGRFTSSLNTIASFNTRFGGIMTSKQLCECPSINHRSFHFGYAQEFKKILCSIQDIFLDCTSSNWEDLIVWIMNGRSASPKLFVLPQDDLRTPCTIIKCFFIFNMSTETGHL